MRPVTSAECAAAASIGSPAAVPLVAEAVGMDVAAEASTLGTSASSTSDPHEIGAAVSIVDGNTGSHNVNGGTTGIEEQLELCKEENARLRAEKAELEAIASKPCKPGWVLESDDTVHYYTGLPSVKVFHSLLDLILPHLNQKVKSGRPRQLQPADEFLLVLMRLRLGLQIEDLQHRFRLKAKSRASKIIKKWIPLLACAFKPLLVWPSRRRVLQCMPAAFKAQQTYKNVRIILDCAEFEMEAPSSLSLNTMTYSSYKGRNTVKVLFGVTPDGFVSFVSRAYPGSISDNSITIKSGILDMLSPGDDIMADKGFTLSNSELQPRGLRVVVPPFRCGAVQFSTQEVETTKVIANLRIVVENCIMRTRYCRFLRNRIPVSSVRTASDIVLICAVLANLRPPIR